MRRALPLLALLWAAPALAHQPVEVKADKPWSTSDTGVSWAVYGEFTRGDEVFELDLTFAERFAAPFEVLVPHKDEWKDLRPRYAVVGPGLPAPNAEVRALLPRPLPDGWGAYLEDNSIDPRPVTFESFTSRSMWGSGPLALVMPRGQVQVWVWSPEHRTGEFILGFGVEEGAFGFGTVVELARHWGLYGF